MKYMSLSAAEHTLKRFYSKNPGASSLSLKQVYEAANRDLNQDEVNKSWLGNKLTHLKHHGLVEPTYTYGERKTLTGIELTNKGKSLLGYSYTNQAETNATATIVNSRVVTLESLAQDIKEFRKQNPSVRIRLVVDLDGEDALSN